jgi:hypothetical protein
VLQIIFSVGVESLFEVDAPEVAGFVDVYDVITRYALKQLDDKVCGRAVVSRLGVVNDGFEFASFSKMLLNVSGLRGRHYIIALCAIIHSYSNIIQ